MRVEEGSSMTIGEYLRKSREARHLTIGEISQDLHIREEYLQALEIDAWDKLPGEVYGQGFLRSYAKYLDLDAEALVSYRKRLDARNSEAAGPAPAPDHPPLSRRNRKAVPGSVAPSGKTSGSRRHGPVKTSTAPSPMDSGRAVVGAALVLVILFVVGFILMKPHHQKTVAAHTHHPTASTTTHHKAKHASKHHRSHSVASSAPVVTETASNTAQGTASYQVSKSPVSVSLTFLGTCWVEVWQNGTTKNRYGVTYYKGQTLTVSAGQSVAVRLGSRAVSMTVDSQTVPLPDAPTYPLQLTFRHS